MLQTTPTPSPSPLQDSLVEPLTDASGVNDQDDPNYYAKDPRSLISESTVDSFMVGTGDAIYRSLKPLLESTNQELILVTCFWARSSTLETLNSVLRALSDKAMRRGTEKIRVRLCFSSSSLFQKLFHKQTVAGQIYDRSSWTKQFGLPDPSELSGLDLQIKSIFILPFSVMHPKFIIIDRRHVVLPSCNISWEEWFEGAITFTGPIVTQFTTFYENFWVRHPLPDLPDLPNPPPGPSPPSKAPPEEPQDLGHAHLITHISPTAPIPTIFLPSPHRRNPSFQPLASPSSISTPRTPLNSTILKLLSTADSHIRIQTPNLTSPPVLAALLAALTRGVAVTILTSSRLMILEQLVTAGTTTSRCVATLIKRYKAVRAGHAEVDEEAAIAATRAGELKIAYFEPVGGLKGRGEEGGEPQQSHLKMLSVDGRVVVLGSGNLDRASWFTSQELGVAVWDEGVVRVVEGMVERAMEGRRRVVYDSGEEGM